MKLKIYYLTVLLALAIQCCAGTAPNDTTPFSNDSERLADSAFNAMTQDERVMQLYIYAPASGTNYILQSGPVPGGVLLKVSTSYIMRKQIESLGTWNGAPEIVAVDIDGPIPATPNYMNPHAVAASRHDSLVRRIVTENLEDTLMAIGFNATMGLTATNYGAHPDHKHARRLSIINATDTLSTFAMTPESSVKTALESDNSLIVGTITPEMFLVRAQKSLKDHPELAEAVDYKAHQILRIKYALPHPTPPSRVKTPHTEAAAICAMKTINCLRNDNKMLPLQTGAPIDIIQIGGLPLAGFTTQAATYGDYSFKHSLATVESVNDALKSRHKNRKCIILINTTISDSEIISAINKAATATKTCVINFDNQENIPHIASKCLIQQIGNNTASSQMAARAVFGSLDIKGDVKIKANKLKYCILKETGFNIAYKDTLDSIIRNAIQEGCFPGCQVFAAKDGKILIDKAYGHLSYDTLQRSATTSDLYDIASLTKVTATTLMAMYLNDQGMMDPEKPLGDYLHYDDSVRHNVLDVSVKAILQHRSGIYAYPPIIRFVNNANGWRRVGKVLGIDTLPLNALAKVAYNEIYSPSFKKDSATTRVADSLWLRDAYKDSLRKFYMQLSVKKNKKYQYSDVNMILLQWAEEETLKCRADSFLNRTFYRPLGMTRTTYTPLRYKFSSSEIAPTEIQPWTGKMLQGDVHDPAAALLGGIAGNAGLFSTAHNVGILFQMLLNGGEYGGRRYLKKETIELFTNRQPNTSRALGFDMAPNNFTAITASPNTYGHTGFTGGCAWADPDNKIVVVFLSNRVHPDSNNKKITTLKIRQKVCQAIYDGIGIRNEE